jgi:hypothetical protein
MDNWISVRREWIPPTGSCLVEIARGIDPDPLRNAVRATWGKSEAEVADELRRLAESIDVRAHDSATLVKLARALERAKQSDVALRLLRDTRDAYPGDYSANYYLAAALRSAEGR